MSQPIHHKTIVLSDIHIGSEWSKIKEVAQFLKRNTCDTLILCGDIIDGWNLMRGSKWRKRHTKFIQLLLEIQYNTQIFYIRGNHDDFLDEVIPIKFQNIQILKEFIYTSAGKSYYVTHGDIFDTVTSHFAWLAKLGDIGYTWLMWINKHYNAMRVRKNLPYYSLSQKIKGKVKSAVSYISDFEKHLTQVARKKGCDGVICGHIHHPENRYYDEIHYLNAGDWVESLSALTEDNEGNWNIVYSPISPLPPLLPQQERRGAKRKDRGGLSDEK